jgi:hypothetical protein
MLADELTGELAIKSARGLDEEIIRRARIPLGDRIAGWVALEGKPLLIKDIERDPRFRIRNIPQYNTRSLLSLPLKIGDKVIGVINLNNKKTAEPFSEQDLHIASVLGERISYFIEKLLSGEYGEDEVREFGSSIENLFGMGKSLRVKGHQFADLIGKIMDHLGAKEEDKRVALYVSMIYDFGLVPFDDSIMKKERLSSADVHSIKIHPYTAIDLINNFEFSEDVKKAILHHHERYDGTGYPDGLRGEEIPLISRVLSVGDTYYAMIAERPYRKASTEAEALEEIRKNAGSLYDPRVVEALEKVLLDHPG